MPLHKNTSEKNYNPKMWNDSVQETGLWHALFSLWIHLMIFFVWFFFCLSNYFKSFPVITNLMQNDRLLKKLGRAAKDENLFFFPTWKGYFLISFSFGYYISQFHGKPYTFTNNLSFICMCIMCKVTYLKVVSQYFYCFWLFWYWNNTKIWKAKTPFILSFF